MDAPTDNNADPSFSQGAGLYDYDSWGGLDPRMMAAGLAEPRTDLDQFSHAPAIPAASYYDTGWYDSDIQQTGYDASQLGYRSR
jgi:hypothetical protein